MRGGCRPHGPCDVLSVFEVGITGHPRTERRGGCARPLPTVEQQIEANTRRPAASALLRHTCFTPTRWCQTNRPHSKTRGQSVPEPVHLRHGSSDALGKRAMMRQVGVRTGGGVAPGGAHPVIEFRQFVIAQGRLHPEESRGLLLGDERSDCLDHPREEIWEVG